MHLILTGFFVLSIDYRFSCRHVSCFYLSSFKPVRILKSKFSNSLAAVSVRKGLVVFQFVISAILIIASTVIAKQMQYMRSKDLGFTKDQEMIIPLRTEIAKATYQSLKTEINKMPGCSFCWRFYLLPRDIQSQRQGLIQRRPDC
jgi:putative ABC transport system permease protein